MLEALKFVKGAVAKNNTVPEMTHFVIQSGRVTAYNGTLALSSPIPFDIDCIPKAVPLLKAIANCNDTASLTMTAAGKLKVQSGKFKAFIECLDESRANVEPDGTVIDIVGDTLLEGLRAIEPFIGTDKNHPWCTGALFTGGSVAATNNVTLIEYWIGTGFTQRVVIPHIAIKTMLSINEAPAKVQLSNYSISFHYSEGRWLRTQLLQYDWPDFTTILDKDVNAIPFDARIYEALKVLKPFTDSMDRVFISDDKISTSENQNEGAIYDVPGLKCNGIFQVKALELLQDVAVRADMTRYPEPCIFYGNKLRGAIIGIRI